MDTAGTSFPCPSCKHLVTDQFCPHCGEKRPGHHDYSIMHYVEETLEGFTHFDNKFFRSLKLLITRPGLLTLHHFEGRRIPYMKPLQLFIVCNVLFFLVLGKHNVFALTLSNYVDFSPYTSFGTRQAVEAKASNQQSFNNLAEHFNEKMISQSKTFLIIFIPLIAAYLSLFFIGRKRFFVEHLTFATHFFSFLMLFYIMVRYVAEWPFSLITGKNYSSTFDLTISLLTLSVLAVYFGRAAKRFYGISKLKAALSGLFFTVIFTFSIYAYRMFLFYKILHAI
ncbi:MAG: DUF3667 domain-containing protein [Ferruginibacter sp.]